MTGFTPKAVVIDDRGYMMGRLGSIVAKLILNGQWSEACHRHM